MKVLHIITSGRGGAAIACHRLHHLMVKNGLQSRVLHLYEGYDTEKEYFSLGYPMIRRLVNHANYLFLRKCLTPDTYVFSEPTLISSQVAKHPLVSEADVIYLHWVLGGFFSRRDFEEIAKLNKPIICFTHDMWWFTGGCHHTFDCDKFKSGCDGCPKRLRFSSLTRNQAEWKCEWYRRHPNVHLVSPSNWIKNLLEESYVIGKGRCEYIPNIVPSSIFHYIDKRKAREQLGLPQRDIIISFGTADNKSPVKGFLYLLDALKKLKGNQIMLTIYGSALDQSILNQINIPLKFLGRLTPENVALANAASDVFISPTMAESFGQTLLENIMCGTPVISTNCTAVPEIVRDGVNGVLVEPGSSEALYVAIKNFIEHPMVIDGSIDDVFLEKSIFEKHIQLMNNMLAYKC